MRKIMEHEISRILIVDDTPQNLKVLTEVLDDEGFELLFAMDGRTALERVHYANPNLILLDVMMPDMDGFETCKKLKESEKTKDIPIIFMTALTSTKDKVQAFQLGAVDYITKPIQPDEVLARVRTHLKIQSLQNDLRIKNKELEKALIHEKELNGLKSRVLSIASHDLRNPLASIKILANLLIRYSNRLTEEKKLYNIKKIKEVADQMSGMLDELLLYTKVDAGKIEFHGEHIQLDRFCKDIAEQFTLISENTHTISFSATGIDFNIIADPKLLNHIFSNLLSNAIKYSSAGTVVSFELKEEKDEFVIRIKDQGIGISEEDQSKLFTAFHRGENVGNIKGTGLGLSIVKQFVELHKGTIDVHSEIDKGTIFTIKLPKSWELYQS